MKKSKRNVKNSNQLELQVFSDVSFGEKKEKEKNLFFSDVDRKNIREMSKNSSNYSW
ncbi:hypothetical protein [Marinobacter sp. NP-4(2019)]|uniref:hypothetical protein n=1 Tax=Marinobacter sp. NP-4(2019) TaxID=2488665 RepID=UPI0013E003D7|nr:hypothetical protein [Marinobacter sp. NP-4(2019)]